MNKFVASNGWRVAVNEVPGKAEIDIVDSHGGGDGQVLNVLPSQLDALREFFLAERDAELGRWRSKEHPEYVVYPNPNGTVYVVDESRPGGENEWIRRGQWVGESAYYPARQVANEFFAAHPVSKPWHDAKPGEVWVVKIDSQPEQAMTVHLGDFDSNDLRVPITSPLIESARRIWPESNQP